MVSKLNQHLFALLNSNRSFNVNETDVTNVPTHEDNYQEPVLFDSAQTSRSSIISPSLVTDDTLREMIRSLNCQQREVFNIIYSWAKKKYIYSNCALKHEVNPVGLFVSGGAGVGKSYLMKTIFEALTKILNFHARSPDKVKVSKIAPTGVAAINFDGTTVNTALCIPLNQSVNLNKLSDNLRSTLRNNYSELSAVIIDEISMVSNARLYQIHSRLCEIFNVPLDAPFANLTVLIVGDFYQLPPVRGEKQKVFMPFKNELLNLYHPWHHFDFFELTEIMRQQGDNTFIDLLNNVRIGKVYESDIVLLESRKSDVQIPPDDSIHLFAENSEKDKLNLSKLSLLVTPLVTVKAIDKFPTGTCQSKIDQILSYLESRTGRLTSLLSIKKNAYVMLTNNIDINDRLINGQIGTVYDIKFDAQSQVQVIYIKFNDHKAGLMKMRSDPYASQNNIVPIHRVELNIAMSVSGSGPSFVRTQFPLMLAWACTVHKVQGLTLSNVVVSFELNRQKRFNYGQIYIALSRSRALSNLFIKGTVKATMMNTDADVCEEYARLRTQCSFPCNNTQEQLLKFSITLLNIRSLQKHSIDLSNDVLHVKSHVLCLTETQLCNDNFYDIIQQHFDNHQLLLHNNSDKFKSLALLKPINLDCNIERFDGVFVFRVLTKRHRNDNGASFVP